jgi:hypothetical protein
MDGDGLDGQDGSIGGDGQRHTLLRLRGCTGKRRLRQKGRGWSTSALARRARGADDWRETEAVSGPGRLLRG